GQISGTGNISNIGLEIFNFIEDRRIVQHSLLRAVLRIEAGVERDTLAGTGVELPNDSVGEALKMATTATLPTFAREPIVQGVGSWNDIEVAAGGEKHFCTNEVGLSCRARGRQIRA